MKRITLNPVSRLKIYVSGNRKFKAGESHRFNDSTANKFLKDEINGVPCFIEVEDKPDAADVTEPNHGKTDQMDRNDAVKTEETADTVKEEVEEI
ncbi:coil containing protein [Vibrio phage 1.215.B._10N.222.54.F7]|nr:coil containing protein [Vibrio phage 1.215.A._10N.222.54.F7]AUR96095.1 coil containing protein [Vibrio phage 1.215.B._10N.222.54.F7]